MYDKAEKGTLRGTEYHLLGQTLLLLPEKAIYWVEEKNLLLADLHLGKVNHFRKAGIPIPAAAAHGTLDALSRLVDQLQPQTVTFIGDLFHSTINKEWEVFNTWRAQYPHIQVELIRGNHDIMPAIYYKDAGVKVYPVCLLREPFLFCHEPQEEHATQGYYTFSGHLHPGVRLTGAGRQSVALPCFYFTENYALLPAYGRFTGLYRIRPKSTDTVFVVAEDRVMQV